MCCCCGCKTHFGIWPWFEEDPKRIYIAVVILLAVVLCCLASLALIALVVGLAVRVNPLFNLSIHTTVSRRERGRETPAPNANTCSCTTRVTDTRLRQHLLHPPDQVLNLTGWAVLVATEGSAGKVPVLLDRRLFIYSICEGFVLRL